MSDSDAPKPWPPRAGLKFFLLWMAAIALKHILEYGYNTSVGLSGLGGVGGYAVGMLLIIAGLSWQAWLIFRPGWRFAGWIAIPTICVGTFLALLLFGTGYDRPRMMEVYRGLRVAIPLLETLLLIGVRRHFWAWMLVECLVVKLDDFGGLDGLLPFLHSLLSQVNAMAPFLTSSHLHSAVYAGETLLFSAISAAVLAWWMPPITRENRTASKPPRDPRNDS